MKVRIIGLFLLIVLSVDAAGQVVFMKDMKTLLHNKGLSGAGCGISVVESATGKEVVKYNERTALVPASILKTVTTATALEVLGENYLFGTSLGYSGEIDSGTGVLKGNLTVIGGGDPTLGSEYFKDFYNSIDFMDRWVDEIAAKGIKEIDGNLIVDAAIYQDEEIPGTWVWDDIGNYYGAGASGITVYDNQFRIVFRSGAAGELTEILRTVPEIPGMEIRNEVRASKVNRDNADVFGSPWGGKRVIRGTIPENREEFSIKASLPEPAKFLGERLMHRLIEKGITVNGQVLLQKADTTGFNMIYIQKSPVLSEIVKVLNHESVNLFAEHLLKHIAFTQTGSGIVSEVTVFVGNFWKAKGLDISGMFLEDESGLSRFNAISTSQLTWILNYMKTQSPAYSAFYESLPTAGKGTLTVFSPADFPDDCLKAKSGSMTRVRSYAGYLKTESGKELVFAFIFNNFSLTQSELTREIGKLLVALRKQ